MNEGWERFRFGIVSPKLVDPGSMYSRPCRRRKDGPPDIRDVEWRSRTRKGWPPAVLRLPGVNRVLGHSHFSRHVFRFPTRLQLLQRPNHLRFRMLTLRHRLAPFRNVKSYSLVRGFRGARQRRRCWAGHSRSVSVLTDFARLCSRQFLHTFLSPGSRPGRSPVVCGKDLPNVSMLRIG